MKILKNNTTLKVINKDLKTKQYRVYNQIIKTSNEDVFYSIVVAEVLKYQTKKLNHPAFELIKAHNYDAIFEVEVYDYKDVIIIEYILDYINPIYVNDLEEEYLINIFKDVIKNDSYNNEILEQVLSFEKLILNDLRQDNMQLVDKLLQDQLFKDNKYYLTLEQQQEQLNKFSKSKFDNMVEKFKVVDYTSIMSGDSEQFSKINLNFIRKTPYKVQKYQTFKNEDLVIKKRLEQATIAIAFKFMKPISNEVKLLLNYMLGGGSQSTLFTIIREEMQLCYYVYSQFINNTTIVIYLGTNSDKIKQALVAIDNIMNNYINYVTKELFLISKNNIINQCKKQKNNSNFQIKLCRNYIYNDSKYQINEIINLIDEVTYEEIIKAYIEIKKICHVIIK